MDYDPKLVTAPLNEPLRLTEVKRNLRMDAEDKSLDDDLKALISTARIWAENERSQRFIEQTWDFRLPGGFPCPQSLYVMSPYEIRIPRTPLQLANGITHVKYLDTNGTQQTMAAGATGYVLGVSGDRAFIMPAYGIYWPATRITIGVNGEFPVEIRCILGFGANPGTVPAHIRNAMMLHIEAGFDRDPDTVDMLMDRARALLWQDRNIVW